MVIKSVKFMNGFQHGELEGYRASDGEHLGAFDPKTGKQVKGPDPKRNIKKYL
ncbi:hypothetical protein [Klebsiella pneumoniae]|nr:hypothetical protein [Klebsiella pneumoniae]